MADNNVVQAQKYLNAMFGGHSDWIDLEEDGSTGTSTMEGIIRAFQIWNNVTSVTGTVGPKTITKMKSLPVIQKMSPDDDGNVNVCLIQCALFCKGYNAGGITGIYYNAGVAAVKQMQSDAGITATGMIDWKVWSGLLSLNWFTRVYGGDNDIRNIQQQLNRDYSSVIGVGPCDGIASRQTILALVGALQAELNVTTDLIVDLNEVNFGNATTAAFMSFPSSLKENQNASNYTALNRLAQYGLFFNGYDTIRYDGIFDATTRQFVSEFQAFYKLTNINLVVEGEVNVATMKSLLTSKGDTSRKARACDCATVLNQKQAFDLKNAGYTHVGRYLTGSVGNEFISKSITLNEIEYIQNAGLSVFTIYQDGGYREDYFKNATQGSVDAQMAVLAAERIGVPANSVIYFAVDYDCFGEQIDDLIIPYFSKIKIFFNSSSNSKKYRVGIYAPRNVCTRVSLARLADFSFVGDMSTGFSGNLGYPIPYNWSFDQFYEMDFVSAPSFPIDKDAYSGRDVGISHFDTVSSKTDDEINQENQDALIEIARNQYVYNVVKPLGYLDKILGIDFSYGVEVPLANFVCPTGEVSLAMLVSTDILVPSQSAFSINVSTDSSGNLSAGCKSKLAEISAEINKGNVEGVASYAGILQNIALSIKSGNIVFEMDCFDAHHAKFSITVSTYDVLPESVEKAASISVRLIFDMTFYDSSTKQFNKEAFKDTVEVVAIAVGIGVCAVAVVVGGVEMLAAFVTYLLGVAPYLIK